MDFHQQSIRASSNCRARHWQYLVALAGAVAGINNNGQVAQLLHCGNNAEIKSVAGMIGKSTHSALAEYDFIIAFAEHVFSRHQEFFQGGGHAALEQHRFAQTAGAEEARPGSGHALSDCECLLTGFYGAWAGGNAEIASAKTTVSLRKTDDRIFFFYVTAHQLIGFADTDDILHSCHFVQSARFH